MLPEVICAEKLLLLIAFAIFVHIVQMIASLIPVGRIGKLVTAISADVGGGR
jgi:hypothetical protein